MAMRKVLLFIATFLTFTVQLMATHNRAGEITYRQLSSLTFEITIITYTSTGPNWTADRPTLEVFWGDNTSEYLPRVEEVFLPDYYKRNKYVGIHTYPGPGIFEIVVEDPNRNYGVENIPNSVNTLFAISTTMQINAELGVNNTPVLTQPPVDKAAKGRIFIHNPGAYDPDGDSISYKLTICRGDNGEPITGYTLPEASHSITVNEITGDLVWDAPVMVGVYNVAMLIEEWRKGIKIGQIIRDMQIEVFDTENKPPVVIAPDVLCVEAGTFVEIPFTVSDPDGDSLKISANGGPFLHPDGAALIDWQYDGNGQASGVFRWQTVCGHVRRHSYLVNIKAEDITNLVNLVDIKNINIFVVGPAVENLQVSPGNDFINVNWSANVCSNVTSYKIYRRIGPSGFVPDTCQTGVPPETGYVLIDEVSGNQTTSYTDDNHGDGLAQGFEYCYIITAVFPDGTEGYASAEACTPLVRGIPAITNVSVLVTDNQVGQMYVAWSKSTEFDAVAAPGPYKYLIYRSEGLFGENLQLIDSTQHIDDTIYYDSQLNTRDNPYSYKIAFYNDEPGNRFLIGTPHIASSVFLRPEAEDNALMLHFDKNVPWLNQEYTVYRLNEDTQLFDSIGSSATNTYRDSNLQNGKLYCYYVRSTGSYGISTIINPIINLSQENCAAPIDTVAPCAPLLTAVSECDSLFNRLQWSFNDTCLNDIEHVEVYYSPVLDGIGELIYSSSGNDTLQFRHYPSLGMAGCYYVVAVDSFGNVSPRSNRVCLDNCTYYRLPNIFTPNGDGINDVFTPQKPYYFIEKIRITIQNRWGIVVFETDNPDINWDGRYFKNNRMVSDGVYFYVCDVYEQRLTGETVRHLTGFIHVITATETNQVGE